MRPFDIEGYWLRLRLAGELRRGNIYRALILEKKIADRRPRNPWGRQRQRD